MSSRAARRPQPDGVRAQPPAAGENLVQELLAERRELLIANERLRLELGEASAQDRTNPRVRELETEVRRLRHELEMVGAERDLLRRGLTAIADRLRRAGGRVDGPE
jgi:hypothetical protein